MQALPEIKIHKMVLGFVQTNTYIIANEQTKEAVIIDPAARGDLIIEELAKHQLTLGAVLLTHGHFDHIMGIEAMRDALSVKVYAHEQEQKLLQEADLNLSKPFTGKPYAIQADEYLVDGQEFEVAGLRVRTIHTPGHTAGGCCYYFEDYSLLASGDTLFKQTIGRTDFPTGDYATLKKSIVEKVFTLPEETQVLPGHEETTTIGYEKKHNYEVK